MRRGSTTTRRAPAARARCTSGGKWMFEIAGFAPHTTTSLLCTTSSGSADSIEPNVDCHAAPAVAAQIVCSTRAAPSSSNKRHVRPADASDPADELYRYGTTEAGPSSAIAAEIRAATRSRASSHDTTRNSPAPFRPTRTSGVSRRSGAYTRRACCLTLAQMKPWVIGFAGPASIATSRPSSTETSSEQVSGQSSGHAVESRTVTSCTLWCGHAHRDLHGGCQ